VSTSLSFDAAWRDLHRRSAILWALFFGCLPGTFLLAWLLNDLLLQDASLLLVAFAWMAAIAWAGNRMATFACPRCSKAFFENWVFFKPLRRNCAHCSLPRWSKDAPPAATGF
jgi:hypothetical protein